MEIVGQLEKCEDDFEGWMMLARLYATRDRDLRATEKVVRDLCEQGNLTANQVSTALHKLAGWYLSLDDDPVSARTALAEISRRYPKTELAEQAENRRNLIPESKEEWLNYKKKIAYSPRNQW